MDNRKQECCGRCVSFDGDIDDGIQYCDELDSWVDAKKFCCNRFTQKKSVPLKVKGARVYEHTDRPSPEESMPAIEQNSKNSGGLSKAQNAVCAAPGNFPKPECAKMLAVSIAHISEGTNELLMQEAAGEQKTGLTVYDKEGYGYFIYLHVPEAADNIPADLAALLCVASALEAEWINLDGDGPLLPFLPEYHW